MLTPFGKLVRRHRIEQKMLLYHMATALKLSSSYLSDIELGRREIPDGDFLPKVAKTLNLSTEDMGVLYMAAAMSGGSTLMKWAVKKLKEKANG